MESPLVLFSCFLRLLRRNNLLFGSLFPALPCFLSVLEPHLVLGVFHLFLLVRDVGGSHQMG